jgi:hypothetical protein
MTNSEYLLNVFLEQMEAEVFAEHQDTIAVADTDLELFSFDDDRVDVGVPDDFDFTCGG